MSSTIPAPATKQVSYDGIDYDVVREGLAEILNPIKTDSSKAGKNGKVPAQSVFYNPIQQFNRDLSVLAIRVFAEQLVDIRSQKHGKRKNTGASLNNKRKREENNDANDSTTGPGAVKKSRVDTAVESNAETLSHAEKENNRAVPDVEILEPSIEAVDRPAETDGAISVPTGPKISSTEGSMPKIRILDALSASGLRALRYVQEIAPITHVVANDLSVSATKAIDLNVRHNKQENKIKLNTGDATEYMYNSKDKFEVVDLDPYGTAGPFLDAAVQAVTNGGLLCVTCTDSAVFAAAGYCEKTYSVYGGLPIRGPHSHEGGLRLLLHAIATSAAKYGRAIEPVLSLSIDFYIRVFVKVRKSAAEVKLLAGKTMIVYGCDSGCGAWTTQPLARNKEASSKNGTPYFLHTLAQAPSTNLDCEHCGFVRHLHGPMWGGPIHNPYFIQSMLDTLETLPDETYGTKPRMEGMLTIARDETLLSLPTTIEPTVEARVPAHVIDHHPFFFIPSIVAGVLHCNSPSAAHIHGALLRLGYRVARSHAKPGSIKTDAPWTVIWEIMREWIRQLKPIKEESIKPTSAARKILDKRRDRRDDLSQLRDELVALGENKSVQKDDIKTKLESMLFRLRENNSGMDNVNGEEENGPAAAEQKLPLHKLKIVFDERLGRQSEESAGKKLVRYQLNPRPNWGPMSRASVN